MWPLIQVPLQFKLGPLTVLSIGIGLLARGGKGTSYRRSKLPEKPIEIWGYEASPFVKLAREVTKRLPALHIAIISGPPSSHYVSATGATTRD